MGTPMGFFDEEEGRVINVACNDNAKLPFLVQQYKNHWRVFEKHESDFEEIQDTIVETEVDTSVDSSSSSSSSVLGDDNISDPENFFFGQEGEENQQRAAAPSFIL